MGLDKLYPYRIRCAQCGAHEDVMIDVPTDNIDDILCVYARDQIKNKEWLYEYPMSFCCHGCLATYSVRRLTTETFGWNPRTKRYLPEKEAIELLIIALENKLEKLTEEKE